MRKLTVIMLALGLIVVAAAPAQAINWRRLDGRAGKLITKVPGVALKAIRTGVDLPGRVAQTGATGAFVGIVGLQAMALPVIVPAAFMLKGMHDGRGVVGSARMVIPPTMDYARWLLFDRKTLNSPELEAAKARAAGH